MLSQRAPKSILKLIVLPCTTSLPCTHRPRAQRCFLSTAFFASMSGHEGFSVLFSDFRENLLSNPFFFLPFFVRKASQARLTSFLLSSLFRSLFSQARQQLFSSNNFPFFLSSWIKWKRGLSSRSMLPSLLKAVRGGCILFSLRKLTNVLFL